MKSSESSHGPAFLEFYSVPSSDGAAGTFDSLSGCVRAVCIVAPLVADGATTVMDLFESTSFGADLWDECSDLREVFVYVRGSRLFHVPAGWRPFAPNAFVSS